MKLTQEFITKLDEHIANKLINVQYHPTLPLRIFKYSREAQYNCKFNLDDYKDFNVFHKNSPIFYKWGMNCES